jgi:hypothetical protein
MALPTVTKEALVTWLKGRVSGVEVFSEFPSEMKNVRHGVYVSDVVTTNRSPYQLAIQNGSHIYIASDSVSIIFVTFQGDKKSDTVMSAITSIPLDNVLLDGYHQRDFSMSEENLNRAEYRTYDFELNRIEIQ